MIIRNLVHIAAIGVLVGAVGLFGCSLSNSISNSVNSVSDSISNSSDSSSNSSDSSSGGGGSELAAAFRAFTVAHLRTGGTPEELERGLTDVAERRGVTDWEAVPGNFVAVGRALAESGVDGDALVAYREVLVGSDADRRLAFAEGYESFVR